MRCNTVFISDIHLGTTGCQASMLLEFLSQVDPKKLVLVGDVVDAWRLKRSWYWPEDHNDVVRKVLSLAQDGVEIVYIPGNHDEALRDFEGTHFGGVQVTRRSEHVTADGRRFLIIHGDEFDAIVRNAKWLAHLGDRAYEFALSMNTWVNKARQLFGQQYWSLSNWSKLKVKQAVNFISEYERILADEARRGGFDGIICGHIHCAAIRQLGGLEYVNTGDWVESCTAIVEHPDGRLELIDWIERQRSSKADRTSSPSGSRLEAARKSEAA